MREGQKVGKPKNYNQIDKLLAITQDKSLSVFDRSTKKSSFKIQRQVNQADQNRDFHQRPDHRGERHPGADTENRHCHCDGQLEVVGRGSEAQSSGLCVIRPRLPGKEEAHDEHKHEVDEKRNSNSYHIQRNLDDVLTLQGEHHDDSEQEGDQGDGADPGDEFFVIPKLIFYLCQAEARYNSCQKRDAQVDEYALGDLGDGNFYHRAGQPEKRRQHGDEYPSVYRKEQDLEDRVESHQTGGILGVTFGQVVPYEYHGDAAGQPDNDQPHHILRIRAKENYGQEKHQHRPDYPVLDQAKGQDFIVPEYLAHLFITDLGQGRVHHEDEADGDGNVGGSYAEFVPEASHARIQVAPPNSNRHGKKNP